MCEITFLIKPHISGINKWLAKGVEGNIKRGGINAALLALQLTALHRTCLVFFSRALLIIFARLNIFSVA